MENKYNKYPIAPNKYLIENFQAINQKDSFACFEVGCNTGHNLKAIRDLFPNGQYYGIDINEAAIEQGKDNSENLHLIVRNIEDEDLTSICPDLPNPVLFDYILLPDILEHLSNPERALAYLKNFLKPDGRILVSIPNLMHWSVLYNLLCNGMFTYTDTGLLDSDHKHLFTNNEFVNMCYRVELEIIDAFGVDLNNNIYEDSIRKFIDQLSLFGQDESVFRSFSYHFILGVKHD